MRFAQGTVSEKYEAGEGSGHSTVRINGTFVMDDGRSVPVQVILSTPDYTLLNSFNRQNTYEFEMTEIAREQPTPLAAPRAAAAAAVAPVTVSSMAPSGVPASDIAAATTVAPVAAAPTQGT